MTMEQKVRKRYARAVRQFVKTDNERFLHHMEVLSEVLGLTPSEEIEAMEQALKGVDPVERIVKELNVVPVDELTMVRR